MKSLLFALIVVFFFSFCPEARAQVRPFLFTVTLPDTTERQAIVHFDAGWGDGSLGFSEEPFIDERIGAIWRANSRWAMLGNFGFGKDSDSDIAFSGQAQVFYVFRDRPDARFSLSAGGGMRWERDGGNVALATVLTGWETPAWRFDGNVVFEKANSSDRDPIDLIVSTGWLYKISSPIGIGVEVVGQDLEGFWETNEAEGGARILVGPTIHFTSGFWEAGITGGYVFRPTVSNQTSPADRPFGSDRILLQITVGRAF